MNIEFLDLLYNWKVQDEQYLNKLLIDRNDQNKLLVDRSDSFDPLSAEIANHTLEIRDLKIKHMEETVNRHKIAIKFYLTTHT